MHTTCFFFKCIKLVNFVCFRGILVTSSVRSARVTTIRLKSWTPTTRETTRPGKGKKDHLTQIWRQTESTSASFATGRTRSHKVFTSTSDKCTDESRLLKDRTGEQIKINPPPSKPFEEQHRNKQKICRDTRASH